jgi:uncharacterized protein YcaQ
MSAAERKDVMASMSDNFENQEDPKVGIFWYDETGDELFGVTATYADQLPFNANGVKTERTLHKSWWKKQQEKAKAKNQFASIFMKDYTLIPRGRVFQRKDGTFELMCGSWINEHIVELVKDEFNLWNVLLEVKIDTHWEIGHGWSEEYL